MKKTYFIIITLLASFFISCQTDEKNEPERNNLKLTSTAESVILDENKQNENVITFEWNDATEIGTDYNFTYLFQLDIADNDFETATNPITIPEGVRSISFTSAQLYDYIVEKWNRPAGQLSQIEGRVVAKVDGPQFKYPEIATTKVSVQTYIPQSQPLYIFGSATPSGTNLNLAVKMNEVSNGRIYTYKGELKQGNFKFIMNLGSDLPSLNRGDKDSVLVLRTLDTEPDNYFTTYQSGLYYIYVSKKEMTIRMNLLKYQSVYLIGNSTTAEWNIDQALEMTPDPISPSTFTIQTTLKAGELKLPTSKSWSAPTFRPMQANGSITDTNTQVSSAADGAQDLKWLVTAAQAGTYKITLDTEKNKIYFVKLN